ncbi:hypothetical protein BpHYR1_042705 [Brachionus plicatilis]|uniref:Uncharacterized protein n=1 Tax=Brachionus plicatilis TaxID=10195 RepID=A0A3M7R0W9_BRAPC|nr:hypothetical protein BpHYR1_042705 [Brachionus plicatilis]
MNRDRLIRLRLNKLRCPYIDCDMNFSLTNYLFCSWCIFIYCHTCLVLCLFLYTGDKKKIKPKPMNKIAEIKASLSNSNPKLIFHLNLNGITPTFSLCSNTTALNVLSYYFVNLSIY